MSNLLFRTWNSLAVCSFYETRSPFSGANIRTCTVHLSIWVRASRHYVWRFSEHTCCYPGIFRCRFHCCFRSGRKSRGRGLGFFSNKSFIIWLAQLWSLIKPFIQPHTLLQQGKKRNRYFLGNSTWFKPKKCMKIKAEKQTSPKNNKKKINSLFWY